MKCTNFFLDFFGILGDIGTMHELLFKKTIYFSCHKIKERTLRLYHVFNEDHFDFLYSYISSQFNLTQEYYIAIEKHHRA